VRLSDRASGAFLVALGGAALWGGSRLPGVPGQDVGPAVFPMVIGIGLMACGAMIALGVGRSFEAEEEDPTAGHSRAFGLRALVPPALLLFYVLASERLGFLLTAAIMILAGALAMGARPWLAALMAVVGPLVVHLAFYQLLRVPLPPGILTAPWAEAG
jgi:putative tricarboxylic transport membrane protein